MKTVHITVGISASGKTTWVREQVKKMARDGISCSEIDRDFIRLYIVGNGCTWAEYKFNKTNEAAVDANAEMMFNSAVEDGVQNIFISNTNLQAEHRNKWIKRAEDAGYDVNIVEFPLSFEESCRRNELRHNGVPRKHIYQQYQMWNAYIGRKTYTPNFENHKCIIVDIDGTVAIKHNRSPFDWKKVGQDKPRTTIIDIIKCFYVANSDVELIFVSGRDSVCRHETLTWISEHFGINIFNINLLMRKTGDQRKDTLVKEEIFWNHIADTYNVIAVFDDRPCVVNMWHDLKIPNVIVVADQNIEF